MSKKRFLSLLFASALLLTLTACGGKGDDSSTTTTAGDDTATTTTVSGESDDTGVTVTDADGNVVTTTTVSGVNGTTTTKNDGNGRTTTTTATTKRADGSTSTEIKRAVTIKKGTTAVESGLNLGGKTVTYAMGLQPTTRMKQQIAKFQATYNCKVEYDVLGFDDYVQQLAAKTAGGKVYDILQVEGVRFPAIVIADFCTPLENVITTADWSGSDISKGGFSEDLTYNFAWNNHLYAVVGVRGEFAPNMQLVYYNKKIFQRAGAEDPRELYEAGKWNYDALYRVGTQIRKGTSNSVYLGNVAFTRVVPMWNNATFIDFSDPANPKASLTSQASINAYNFCQKLTVGANAVVGMENLGDHTPQSFFEGKVAMFTSFWFDLFENYCLGEGVSSSNAFGKSVSNLGMVPHPMGPDNTNNAYMVGSWLYGIGAGVGTSDARIAMAFAKFSSQYESKNTSQYKWSTKDQALIDSLTLAENKVVKFANFSDGSNNANTLVAKMQWEIFSGGDVAQLTSSYNAQVQNCIDVMITQQ